MRIGFILLCVIGSAFFAWFLLSDDVQITNYPPKNERIIAFGDSLIEGVGATEGNDIVSKLSKEIGRPIENFGVGGDTTALGLARIEKALKRDSGIVILLLGGNDTLRRIPEETTRENLAIFIKKFQEQGAVVVLLGIRGGIIGGRRADMYEELSETYGTVYVSDVLDGILLKPELMHDGIHPNDAGYAIIAERLGEVFSEYNL